MLVVSKSQLWMQWIFRLEYTKLTLLPPVSITHFDVYMQSAERRIVCASCCVSSSSSHCNLSDIAHVLRESCGCHSKSFVEDKVTSSVRPRTRSSPVLCFDFAEGCHGFVKGGESWLGVVQDLLTEKESEDEAWSVLKIGKTNPSFLH